MSDDAPVQFSKLELEALIDKASEAGAKRALKEIGLDDVNAGNDLRELRGLLKSWQDMRKSALQAIVKFLTTALLGAILLGAGIKLGGSALLK